MQRASDEQLPQGRDRAECVVRCLHAAIAQLDAAMDENDECVTMVLPVLKHALSAEKVSSEVSRNATLGMQRHDAVSQRLGHLRAFLDATAAFLSDKEGGDALERWSRISAQCVALASMDDERQIYTTHLVPAADGGPRDSRKPGGAAPSSAGDVELF